MLTHFYRLSYGRYSWFTASCSDHVYSLHCSQVLCCVCSEPNRCFQLGLKSSFNKMGWLIKVHTCQFRLLGYIIKLLYNIFNSTPLSLKRNQNNELCYIIRSISWSKSINLLIRHHRLIHDLMSVYLWSIY